MKPYYDDGQIVIYHGDSLEILRTGSTSSSRHDRPPRGVRLMDKYTLLWLLAVVLVCAGIYEIVAKHAILLGVVLIIVGLLVGPGGVSILS